MDKRSEKQVVIDLLAAATENLVVARQLIETDYALATVNRLYYALYQSIQALFLSEGIKVKTHKGLKAKFGELYVQTGQFSTEEATTLGRLYKLRLRADYEATIDASQEEVKLLTDRAELLLKKLKQLVEGNIG